MRFAATTILASLLAALPIGSSALAQQSCFAHRAICESVCTPERVAISYFGSLRRCTASCEPRWSECLRTGIWVDLERRSSGGREYAPAF